jgi:hypothetical protein
MRNTITLLNLLNLIKVYSTQDAVTNEHTLKALFIYNFTKSIEWPSNSNTNSNLLFLAKVK